MCPTLFNRIFCVFPVPAQTEELYVTVHRDGWALRDTYSLLIINNIMTELSLFTLHSFFTIDRTYIEMLMTQLLLATRSETQRAHLFAQTADKSTSAKYIVYSTHPLPNIISDILSNMEKLTLLTTNMEMYKHPRHFPGYTGFTPRAKYTYGETFGNMTARCFHDYREETLNTSKERMGRGGDKDIPFPTYYSHNPNLVIGARTRSRDRWLASPKYTLLNAHGRDEEIKYFDKKAQEHREHYRDRTQTVQPVKIFILPQLFHDTKPKVYPPGEETSNQRKAVDFANRMYKTMNTKPLARSSVDTRRIRDVFFERR